MTNKPERCQSVWRISIDVIEIHTVEIVSSMRHMPIRSAWHPSFHLDLRLKQLMIEVLRKVGEKCIGAYGCWLEFFTDEQSGIRMKMVCEMITPCYLFLIYLTN